MRALYKLFAALFISMTLFVSTSRAQGFDNIESAIGSGDVSTLSQYFSGNVEIHIRDAQNSYSKSQAEAVLKNFFSSHSPRSFSVQHRGESPGGAKYFMGNLSTTAGSYRTYVYAKQVNGVFAIQEIRFEEQ
ncbi:MAG: DUF4783 domain-containing protein [Bacteroidetes bacterium]|nr:DUF4783 domain-containing protein [Bacteroidota bacterium]MBS1686446.1 DUF4783 domain-containing protein [Bacteroidota bacterium]